MVNFSKNLGIKIYFLEDLIQSLTLKSVETTQSSLIPKGKNSGAGTNSILIF